MSNIVVYSLGMTYTPAVISEDGYMSFTKDENWEQVIWDLAEGLISEHYSNDLENVEMQELRIQGFYKCSFEDNIPSFEDVMGEVLSYNWTILKKIAEVDFVNNYGPDREPLTEEEYEREIEWLAEEWQSDMYFSFFNELEEWVGMILDRFKLAYSESEYAPIYRFFDTESTMKLRIVYNECQNLINPEWITVGMLYAENDADLDKIQVVTF